jgi:hypothetical protein
VGPRVCPDECRKSHFTKIGFPDCPACSESLLNSDVLRLIGDSAMQLYSSERL